MQEIDWPNISPSDFELITLRLVEAMGFNQAKRISGPSDRGEDIAAFHPTVSDSSTKRKWVFQSKRVVRLSKLDVKEELANFNGKEIDTWVLVTTFKPSPEYRRWFESLGQAYQFHIDAWWQDDLERFIVKYSDSLGKHLPQRLCEKLNIADVRLPPSVGKFGTIQAKYRHQAADQIELYAKSKYIARLYINRDLQTDLSGFFLTENQIATKIRHRALEVLQEVGSRLRTFPSEYDITTERIREEIQTLQETADETLDEITVLESEIGILNSELQNSSKLKVANKKKKSLVKTNADETESELREKKRSVEEKTRRRKEASETLGKTEVKLREKAQAIKERYPSLQNNKILSAFINKTVRSADELNARIQKLVENGYFSSIQEIRIFLHDVQELTLSLDTEINRHARNLSNKTLSSNRDKRKKPNEKKNPIDILIKDRSLHNIRDSLIEGVGYIENLLRNSLAFIDRAGSGKTNVICHTVTQMSSNEAVLLFFGKETFNGPNGLVEALLQNITRIFKRHEIESLEELNEILEQESRFLNVFIDGINENRNLKEFDSALISYLKFSSNYRIRNIITCRDIYWDFFSVENVENFCQRIIRDSLNTFSPAEYLSAVPLYLDHYNIKCELVDEARDACHHPLLLRFFCEAHASSDSREVYLGKLHDIRLKELFDLYLTKKTEQIRVYLNHRNSDIVNEYLNRLVSQIFTDPSTPITTDQLQNITGDGNIISNDSLYIQLLDEDIIIEEKPSDDISVRQVNFVYEEFMEYLIARTILTNPAKFGFDSAQEIFSELSSLLKTWVNARGVGEYIGLMLMSEDQTIYSRDDAVSFFRRMTENGSIWGRAFWSVISKLPQKILNTDIYDLLFDAIDVVPDVETIKKTVEIVDRHDSSIGRTLAGKIIWSSALPNILSWKQLEKLSELNEDELGNLIVMLAKARGNDTLYSPPGNIKFAKILKALVPYLDDTAKYQIEISIRNFGEPISRAGERSFIRLFWKSFPENYPYLLNGLFGEDEFLREFCADKIQFCKSDHNQIAKICEKLVDLEAVENIKRTLKSSSKFLRSRAGHEVSVGH